jgi:hypothetical protein
LSWLANVPPSRLTSQTVTQLDVSTTNICYRHEAKFFDPVTFLDHNSTLRINVTVQWLQSLRQV